MAYIGQLPGALAAIGLALALVGLAPRRWPLVWAVVAWSAFARFLGGLVELPDWARDMSVIGHYLDVTGPVDWKPLAMQGAVGCLIKPQFEAGKGHVNSKGIDRRAHV